jgi:hypothetical protein
MFYSLINPYQSFTSVLIRYYTASTPFLSLFLGFNYFKYYKSFSLYL